MQHAALDLNSDCRHAYSRRHFREACARPPVPARHSLITSEVPCGGSGFLWAMERLCNFHFDIALARPSAPRPVLAGLYGAHCGRRRDRLLIIQAAPSNRLTHSLAQSPIAEL